MPYGDTLLTVIIFFYIGIAMTTRKLEVVVYRESDACVAQCLNINVASEGNTEEEALANLQEALELYFKDDEEAAVAPVTQAKLTQLTLRHA